ncbi:MAG TPA: hypothetical protein VMG10_22410 [Gemmataceae bacterium]|nr:hypothetical protein [Gemmataceae bacterium]
MGWWRIDPQTGEPLSNSRSRLSRSPDFVLLNAVPSVDNDEEAHYLGDDPWDFAYSAVQKINALIVRMPTPSENELRQLFLERVIPQTFQQRKPEAIASMLQTVDKLWENVNWVYEEDWKRPALPAEKRWVCEYAVRRLTERD